MLKKIFAVFFAGVFFVAGANAAVDERGSCVAYAGATAAPYQQISADYVVYFDNGNPEDVGSKIPDACKGEVDDLIKKLAQNKNDIETVLLFGMADGSGNANLNARLGRDRMLTVEKLLNDAGVPVCTKDENRCARISMGDAMDRAVGNKNSYNIDRAVFMFVINKGDICDKSTIDALDALINVLPNEKELQDARKLCKNQNDLLLRSQRKQIMDAISAAIQKYPEKVEKIDLSQDEKARLLMVSLVHVRNDAIANRSVWTTEEGKFNYARLASDSVAGIVLGTAGGLITSKIVKKNQLSKGLENIMCTIGGQSVASYGDEFSVGIKAK